MAHGNNPAADGTLAAVGVVNSKEEQALDSLLKARAALGDEEAGWNEASRYWLGQGLEWWKKCSGLHTVEQWVEKYNKHPAGRGALLMIHGVPEVTGRLRSKVENYAMYSALFLSWSCPCIFSSIPDPIAQPCPGEDLVDKVQRQHVQRAPRVEREPSHARPRQKRASGEGSGRRSRRG